MEKEGMPLSQEQTLINAGNGIWVYMIAPWDLKNQILIEGRAWDIRTYPWEVPPTN